MGVCISLYAVDVPKFEEFIDQSLAVILWDYVQYGSDEWPQRFTFPGSIHYESLPSSGARRFETKKKPIALTETEIFTESILSISARDYLTNESSYDLKFFLRALSLSSSLNWVEEITKGYRRWCIGSFLDYLDRNKILSSQDSDRIVSIFQKVLGPYKCGKILPKVEYELSDFVFPVVPTVDADLWMGVWDEEEINFVVDLIRMLMSVNKLNFKAPPMKTGFGPETDEEWNEWVHSMLDQLIRMGDLEYEQPSAVSFIG